ncbi:MAG: hypothetical protein HY720_25880 [Planctomycetes bacterium]|nr:hypothetical protein [Planctomycetota bacterium]
MNRNALISTIPFPSPMPIPPFATSPAAKLGVLDPEALGIIVVCRTGLFSSKAK